VSQQLVQLLLAPRCFSLGKHGGQGGKAILFDAEKVSGFNFRSIALDESSSVSSRLCDFQFSPALGVLYYTHAHNINPIPTQSY
jgi:hypothetical protein